jgi:hypothetical protein
VRVDGPPRTRRRSVSHGPCEVPNYSPVVRPTRSICLRGGTRRSPMTSILRLPSSQPGDGWVRGEEGGPGSPLGRSAAQSSSPATRLPDSHTGSSRCTTGADTSPPCTSEHFGRGATVRRPPRRTLSVTEQPRFRRPQTAACGTTAVTNPGMSPAPTRALMRVPSRLLPGSWAWRGAESPTWLTRRCGAPPRQTADASSGWRA